MPSRKLSPKTPAKTSSPKRAPVQPRPPKATIISSRKAKVADLTTQVCLVLDRSGSMLARRDDALGSVNTYIAEAQKKGSPLAGSRFSLLTFNSNSIETPRVDRRPTRTHHQHATAPSLPALRCAARLQPCRCVLTT
jgi:hypothetical protein